LPGILKSFTAGPNHCCADNRDGTGRERLGLLGKKRTKESWRKTRCLRAQVNSDGTTARARGVWAKNGARTSVPTFSAPRYAADVRMLSCCFPCVFGRFSPGWCRPSDPGFATHARTATSGRMTAARRFADRTSRIARHSLRGAARRSAGIRLRRPYSYRSSPTRPAPKCNASLLAE